MSRIKVDRITNRAGTGDPLFPNGISVVGLTSLSNVVAGVATFSNVTIGGTITYDDVTNIDSVGVVTAREGIRIGAGKSIGSDGAAVVYYGDGSNLTGAGPSLANGANNRIVTATGANALTGESKLTYDGTNLKLQQTVNGAYNDIISDANPSGASGTLGLISGYWNGSRVADVLFSSGDDTSNKDNGVINFRTGNAAGECTSRLQIGSVGQIGLPVGPVGTAATDYGTSGQVLTSQGSGSAVQWATPAGGAWSVLTSEDIATSYGQTYWESKGWDVTNYTAYRYIFNQVAVNGGNFDLSIRYYYTPYQNGSASGAESLETGSNYAFRYDRRRLNGSGSSDNDLNEAQWRLGGTESAETWNVDHTVSLSPPTYTNIKSVSGRSFYYKGGELWRIEDDCCLFWHQEGYITGVRVYGSGGNLQHGRFQVLRMSRT